MAHDLTGELILRECFSLTDGALKTVPAAATSFAIELDAADGDSVEVRSMAVDVTTILNAVAASSNQTSSGVNILKYKGFCAFISWTGLDAADGAVKLQASIDDTTYSDITGTSTTMATTPSSILLNITDAYYKYFRVVYTKNSVTTGTVTAKYTTKG